MKRFFCVALFLSGYLFAKSQVYGEDERTWRTMIEGGTEINKFATFDWSARIAEGLEINRQFFIGLTTGFTKFNEHPGVYIPVAAKGMVAINVDGQFVPFFVLEPGYGYYHQQVTVDNKEYTMGGGFCLYAGVGVGYPIDSKTISLSAGYGNFAFSGLPYQLVHTRYTVRLGFVF